VHFVGLVSSVTDKAQNEQYQHFSTKDTEPSTPPPLLSHVHAHMYARAHAHTQSSDISAPAYVVSHNIPHIKLCTLCYSDVDLFCP